MNSENTEDHLDRAKARIRADAEAARERVALPTRIPTASHAVTASDAGAATHTSIAELARPSGRAFVENAYRSILRRPPDTEGFAHQIGVLATGASKIEIIGDMRYSVEGRRNAVQIPGLAPRYLLAKLGRVPVLGLLVQWLGALAALPHMLRYQRATEASLAVRFDEVAIALRASEQRDADLGAAIDAALDEQRNEVARLEHLQHVLSQRIAALEARIPDPDVIELRQLVLSMNHWTVQVRKSIEAIDAAHAERRLSSDESAAHTLRDSRDRDIQRGERLHAWAEQLAAHLGAGADVLDLCSGADWLSELTRRGWRASGIERNAALHRDARELGLSVTLGDPSSLLVRTAADSLDALTIASIARLGEEMPAEDLLRDARRILKSNGVLLIGMDPSGAAESLAAIEALRGIGFGNIRLLESGTASAVMAMRT